jgi:DNA-binding MarR family transcriptional regulator
MARPTTAEYRTLARFRRSLRSFLHFSEEAAKNAGLTPAQHQLLLAVKGFDGGGHPTIGDAAEWLRLKHHSAVELVDRAEAGGLLEREPDPEDARRQRLRLTPEGESRLASLSELHRAELRRFRDEVIEHLGPL